MTVVGLRIESILRASGLGVASSRCSSPIGTPA